MKKTFLLIFLFGVLFSLQATVNMKKPLYISEDSAPIDEDGLCGYTYLKILDSQKPFVINACQDYLQLSNESLYIGRNLEMPRTKDYDDYSGSLPWDFMQSYKGLREMIFGEEVTQLPVYKPDFSCWTGISGGYVREDTPSLRNPFLMRDKSVVRFYCRNLENFYKDETDENQRYKYVGFFSNSEVYIIENTCESFPGNYISPNSSKLIVNREFPPCLQHLSVKKLLIMFRFMYIKDVRKISNLQKVGKNSAI